jgi:hypothetical protein
MQANVLVMSCKARLVIHGAVRLRVRLQGVENEHDVPRVPTARGCHWVRGALVPFSRADLLKGQLRIHEGGGLRWHYTLAKGVKPRGDPRLVRG